MEILAAVAAAFGLAGLILFGLSVRAFRERRWMGTATRSGGSALFASLAALCATLGASTQGYRALTGEEVAMTVTTTPTGDHSFRAHVELPDGRDTTFVVRGDQILVDAHILKWHYWANVFGLDTQYELDRLTGRYVDIEDELTAPRTVHSLKADKRLDLYDLVSRYTFLAALVDAEYGSATFVDVDEPARFEVRVSTTGLLMRKIDLP